MTCQIFAGNEFNFKIKCFVVTLLCMCLIKQKTNNDFHLSIHCKTNLKYIQYVNNYDKNRYLEKIWKAAVYMLSLFSDEL